jgi:glycosyltransferase involved in cell wall biosynthesis
MTRESVPPGKSRTPRLAYLSLHRTRSGQGGATHIEEMLRALRGLGWEVDLFAPSPDGGGRRGPWRLVRQFLGPQLRLVRFLREYDVVYVRHHPVALLCAWACRLLGVRRVEEVNGTLEDWYEIYPAARRLEAVFRRASSSSLRHADAVTAVCEGLASWVRETSGALGVHTIPNAADPEVFRPLEPAEPRYVAFAGALTPWEGVRTLLDAAASPHWPTHVELRVAGEGPLAAEVAAMARSYAHVRYLGRLDRADVPDFVARATAAVSAFHKPPYGASPIKLYEAMAAGVPVVVTEEIGQAEVVRAEVCGLVVPPQAPDALAEAVRELVDDPVEARRRGRRGRQAVVSSHKWIDRGRATDVLLRG